MGDERESETYYSTIWRLYYLASHYLPFNFSYTPLPIPCQTNSSHTRASSLHPSIHPANQPPNHPSINQSIKLGEKWEWRRKNKETREGLVRNGMPALLVTIPLAIHTLLSLNAKFNSVPGSRRHHRRVGGE